MVCIANMSKVLGTLEICSQSEFVQYIIEHFMFIMS